MKTLAATIFLVVSVIHTTIAQTTYYSRLTGGATTDWNLDTSWTTNSNGTGPAAGPPTRSNNVVILAGATIVIDAVNDNNTGGGQSADGLGRSNVGSFIPASTNVNFYHAGNITIEFGATLSTSVPVMLEGTTLVEGTFSFSSQEDFINLGLLYVEAGATFTGADDFILSGTSRTIINNTTTVNDDLYLDHTEARLCGSGVLNLGNNPNTTDILYLNGASINQVCSGFQITCTLNCNTAPDVGTGGFSFDLTQFNYSKTFTIDNARVTGDLTNFPVLISYSDASIRTVADGGGVENSNGYDIVFATSPTCGVLTILDHQLESYSSNGTTGTLIAWVKVPAVADLTDTDIYMYYGNSSVTQDVSVTSTYDLDYISVWHMNEDPSVSNILDATSTGHDGTPNGTLSGNVTGQIGNAIDFAGTPAADDYIQTTSNELATENNFTISSWFNADATDPRHILWQGFSNENGWGGDPANSTQEMHLSTGYCCPGGGGIINDRISFFLGDEEEENNPGSSEDVLSIDGGPFSETTNWHHVVGTVTDLGGSPIAELWLDGVSLGTNTGVADPSTARNNWNTNFRMGRPGANERYFDGQLDEVRISRVVRSDAWIQTEYNNQSNPGTFYTITSGVTVNPCGPLPIDLLHFDGFIKNNSVLLTWATSSETNNDYFTIERSFDGKAFENIGIVEGAGNSQTRIDYSFTDNRPGRGYNYYRLKQTDFDGAYSYSKLISISFDEVQSFSINLYPNPSKGEIRLVGSPVFDQQLQIDLLDVSGKKIFETVIYNHSNVLDHVLDLSGFPQGIYYLNLYSTEGKIVKKLIIE